MLTLLKSYVYFFLNLKVKPIADLNLIYLDIKAKHETVVLLYCTGTYEAKNFLNI